MRIVLDLDGMICELKQPDVVMPMSNPSQVQSSGCPKCGRAVTI